MQITKHNQPGTMLVAGQQTMTEKYCNKNSKYCKCLLCLTVACVLTSSTGWPKR